MAGSARRGAWKAGGLLLLALGIGSLAVAVIGLLFGAYGSLAVFSVLAVPPLAAGYGVLRRMRWARLVGLIVALGYGAAVAYIATTPSRGLTPPPGQSAPALDPGSVLVALAFVAAALLLLFGKPDRRPGTR